MVVRPARGVGRNRDDGSAADAEMSDLIQSRLWIDDAAVRDDQIEVLGVDERREADRNGDNQRTCMNAHQFISPARPTLSYGTAPVYPMSLQTAQASI